ncbi:hypothetical protein KAU11_02305, partial [Candidatus Babeliales bacterium]|nr:hypothetical protein [Candidatus Babeliales bacterium]
EKYLPLVLIGTGSAVGLGSIWSLISSEHKRIKQFENLVKNMPLTGDVTQEQAQKKLEELAKAGNLKAPTPLHTYLALRNAELINDKNDSEYDKLFDQALGKELGLISLEEESEKINNKLKAKLLDLFTFKKKIDWNTACSEIFNQLKKQVKESPLAEKILSEKSLPLVLSLIKTKRLTKENCKKALKGAFTFEIYLKQQQERIKTPLRYKPGKNEKNLRELFKDKFDKLVESGDTSISCDLCSTRL